MNVLIEKSTARGSIAAPPSKSECHRALICAALSGGESTAEPISVCDDVLATAYCLRSLGAEITLRGSCAEITGKVKHTEKALFCGESGSTLRFLLPVLLIFGGGTLCGTKRLISRPTAEFLEPSGLLRVRTAARSRFVRSPCAMPTADSFCS